MENTTHNNLEHLLIYLRVEPLCYYLINLHQVQDVDSEMGQQIDSLPQVHLKSRISMTRAHNTPTLEGANVTKQALKLVRVDLGSLDVTRYRWYLTEEVGCPTRP